MSSTYVGNDVYADVLARSNSRTAFDGPVMCNPEIMVNPDSFNKARPKDTQSIVRIANKPDPRIHI